MRRSHVQGGCRGGGAAGSPGGAGALDSQAWSVRSAWVGGCIGGKRTRCESHRNIGLWFRFQACRVTLGKLHTYVVGVACLRVHPAPTHAFARPPLTELSATELPHLDNVRAWDRLCFEQWQSLEQQEQGQGQQQTGQTAGGAGSGTGGGGDGRGTAAGGVGGNGEEEQEEEEDAGPPPPPPTSSPPPGAGGQSGAGGHGGGGGGGETDRLCGPVVRTVLAMDQVRGRTHVRACTVRVVGRGAVLLVGSTAAPATCRTPAAHQRGLQPAPEGPSPSAHSL